MRKLRFRLLFFTPIVAFLLTSFKSAPTLEPTILDWDTHFLASPDENSAFAALTATMWQYRYNAKIRDGHLHIDFFFEAGVEPAKSWVKKNRIRNRAQSRQLLKHEQGHVYINFIQLKHGDSFIRNQNYTTKNYKSLIQRKANELSDMYRKMQDRYDVETKHGSDLEAQDRWDDFLQDEMAKYD